MLKFFEKLIDSNTGYYTLDLLGMSPPDPEAVAIREQRIAAMKQQMGKKYLLHKSVNREQVFPSTTTGAKIRRVK